MRTASRWTDVFSSLLLIILTLWFVESHLLTETSLDSCRSIQVPLPEQDGPSRGTWQKLEMFGSKELAYAIALQDFQLFMSISQVVWTSIDCRSSCLKNSLVSLAARTSLSSLRPIQIWKDNGESRFVHETIQSDSVLDCHRNLFDSKSRKTSSTSQEIHQDRFLVSRVELERRRTSDSLSSSCREYRDLNAFFAIVMGLSNIAVSRLSLTWEVSCSCLTTFDRRNLPRF